MDQRRLRLGDILDDYCPRERRVTNHAVVAMIEEEVKQTRCTTCDAEHVYKGARVPKRRKKETPAALYKDVLAGLPEPEGVPVLAAPVPQIASDIPDATPDPAEHPSQPIEPETILADTDDDQPDMSSDESSLEPGADNVDTVDKAEGPVHRQLLRAKLPRPEGQKDTRPLPEFTVRQPGIRGNGNFRRDRSPVDRSKMRGGSGDPRMMGRGGAPVNGNRAGGDGRGRFHGPRPGQHRNPGGRGGSQGGGFRGGQPRHGGKKGRG